MPQNNQKIKINWDKKNNYNIYKCGSSILMLMPANVSLKINS